jgi:hypothetical protein
VSLSFGSADDFAPDKEVVLYDLHTLTSIDLRGNGEYTYANTTSKTERRFRMAAGSDEFVSSVAKDLIPTEFQLFQNYPNPFNNTTTIKFALPQKATTSLRIYNHIGQLVRRLLDAELSAGVHTCTWRGRDDHSRQVATGIYFIRLEWGGRIEWRKMMYIR